MVQNYRTKSGKTFSFRRRLNTIEESPVAPEVSSESAEKMRALVAKTHLKMNSKQKVSPLSRGV